MDKHGSRAARQQNRNGRCISSYRSAVAALGVLAAALLSHPALGDVLTLPASSDGTLFESATGAESSGIGPTLFVGRIFQSGGLLRRGLVQFELPDTIPADATIENVELGMRLSRLAPDLEQTTLTLHRVLQAWGEGTSNAGGLGGLGVAATAGDVTWSKSIYPSTDWAQPGGSFIGEPSATVTVNELGDIAWQSTDRLVEDVQFWLGNPTANHGWLIRGDEAQLGTAVRLDTRENANPAARPFLSVAYSAPEPSSIVSLALGAFGLAIWRWRRARGRYACALALLLVSARESYAQPDQLPSVPLGKMTVRLEQVAGGLNAPVGDALQYAPTDLAFPRDASGRMFVMTLGGVVRIIQPGGDLLTEPYLNFFGPQTDLLPDSYGMTALAFHPGFSNPSSPGYKKFYTFETEQRDAGVIDMPLSLTGRVQHQSALYEYTADDPAANVFQGSKRQVFRIGEPGPIHNANELTFGPDGYLYVAAGDGCNEPSATGTLCSDNAPYLGNTFGKILRIDPLAPALTPGSGDSISLNGAYRIPRDNPFVDNSEARGEIYALGLRNPYRLSFDRATGRMYVGDVGQRNIEAIDEIVAGGNYGWNLMEGKFLYDKSSQNDLVPDADLDLDGVGDFAAAHGFQEPLFQYDHQDGKSVVGGYVYRGARFPELNGKYLFGDFRGPANLFQGRLFLGDLASQAFEELRISAAGEALPDLIYAFSEDEQGEIYLLGGANDGSTGAIYRLIRENPYGDTNGDGQVDLADLNNVRNNFGGTGEGDANADGAIDLVDLNAVRNNFGAANPLLAPEPSSAALLIVATCLAAWKLRGRSRSLFVPRRFLS